MIRNFTIDDYDEVYSLWNRTPGVGLRSVAIGCRRRTIGRQLINEVIKAMQKENITKLSLVCFSDNENGNNFCGSLGWTMRNDLNYYTVSINEDNR